MEKSKDNLKCKNDKCSYNKEGYCSILTQTQVLNTKTTCAERDW